MVSIPRLISDVIPLGLIGAFYTKILDFSGVTMIQTGKINFFGNLTLIFLAILVVLLIIDFALFGPSEFITGGIVLILASLILQNWVLGLMVAAVNMALLFTIGHSGQDE